MNPKDFIDTADYLLLDEKEASWRSAVSRSYYGAFLYIRDALKRLGIKYDPVGIHKSLPKEIKNSQVSGADTIGNMLQDLRDQRTDADYSISLCFNKKNSMILLEQSKLIIEEFDKLDMVKLWDGITKYRKSCGHS
ncbi:MAG: HEPN domain-containing protein [Candidatus Brocadiae bacterium]|nr:HEPN domain-containing protein [Candidatus Brocadiia bacterium]